ncbi:MAG: hypothetical protein ACE5H0_06215, partial [Bacteroidota bacterium]
MQHDVVQALLHRLPVLRSLERALARLQTIHRRHGVVIVPVPFHEELFVCAIRNTAFYLLKLLFWYFHRRRPP